MLCKSTKNTFRPADGFDHKLVIKLGRRVSPPLKEREGCVGTYCELASSLSSSLTRPARKLSRAELTIII